MQKLIYLPLAFMAWGVAIYFLPRAVRGEMIRTAREEFPRDLSPDAPLFVGSADWEGGSLRRSFDSRFILPKSMAEGKGLPNLVVAVTPTSVLFRPEGFEIVQVPRSSVRIAGNRLTVMRPDGNETVFYLADLAGFRQALA